MSKPGDSGGLPQRRSIRLQGFDYSTTGGYFVTVCAHQKRCLLGRIVDDQVQLNSWGIVARDRWLGLCSHHPGLTLDEFIVMPNHVHGILLIRHGDAATAGRGPTGEAFGSPAAGSLSTIVRSYKSSVTREVRKLCGQRVNIWQPKFWDHVIRSDSDLHAIREYIHLNPKKWALDSENPDCSGLANGDPVCIRGGR